MLDVETRVIATFPPGTPPGTWIAFDNAPDPISPGLMRYARVWGRPSRRRSPARRAWRNFRQKHSGIRHPVRGRQPRPCAVISSAPTRAARSPPLAQVSRSKKASARVWSHRITATCVAEHAQLLEHPDQRQTLAARLALVRGQSVATTARTMGPMLRRLALISYSDDISMNPPLQEKSEAQGERR